MYTWRERETERERETHRERERGRDGRTDRQTGRQIDFIVFFVRILSPNATNMPYL